MPVLDHHAFSQELGAQTTVRLAIPPTGTQWPVLYLLHGRGDDHTAWTTQTHLEHYAVQRQLAVVMPDVGLSYYRNERHGRRYWSFLVDELPQICARQWPISTRRADTFVAGLSMGGYGAMQWALRRPTAFAAAASMSGQLDIARVSSEHDPERRAIWDRVFGAEPLRHTDADLLWLLTQCDRSELPRLLVTCGLDDPMLEATTTFRRAASQAEVELRVDLSPGGHDWAYWDQAIQRVVDWLPIQS